MDFTINIYINGKFNNVFNQITGFSISISH
jgi:hypothetical protein